MIDCITILQYVTVVTLTVVNNLLVWFLIFLHNICHFYSLPYTSCLVYSVLYYPSRKSNYGPASQNGSAD